MNWTGGKLNWIKNRPRLSKKDAEMQKVREHFQQRTNNNNNDNNDQDCPPEEEQNALQANNELASQVSCNNSLNVPPKNATFLFDFFSTPPTKVNVFQFELTNFT